MDILYSERLYHAVVRFLYWLSTENTPKSFITHVLISKVVSLSFIVHHVRISTIPVF